MSSTDSRSFQSLLYAFLFVTANAVFAPASKVCLVYVSPLLFSAIYMTLTGALLLVSRRSLSFDYDRTTLGPILLFSFFGLYIPCIFDAWGLQYVPAAKATFFYNFSPFITAFLAWIVFKERITIKQSLFLLIGCVGFLPVIFGKGPQEYGSLFIFSLPEFVLFISVCSNVYGWLCIRMLMGCNDLPVPALGLGMLCAGIMSGITAYVLEPWAITWTSAEWLGWLVMVIAANAASYLLYSYLLRSYSVTFLSFATVPTPIMTAVYSWIVLKEHMPVSFFIGSLIVLLSVYAFYQDELSEKRKSLYEEAA